MAVCLNKEKCLKLNQIFKCDLLRHNQNNELDSSVLVEGFFFSKHTFPLS